MNKTIDEGEPNMVINDKPAMSPEEEFKSLRRHLQDNWKLAQEFKAHRDGFVVASIIVPIILLLLSNLSSKPMVMDFWLALMIWFLFDGCLCFNRLYPGRTKRYQIFCR